MATRPKKQRSYKRPTPTTGFTAPDYQSRPEYHTARWQRMRRVFLDNPEHVYCVRCKAQGRYSLAKVVDHIIPAEICGDFWDTSNWQPLCNRCNAQKAAEDKRLIQAAREARNLPGAGVGTKKGYEGRENYPFHQVRRHTDKL